MNFLADSNKYKLLGVGIKRKLTDIKLLIREFLTLLSHQEMGYAVKKGYGQDHKV